MIQFNQIRSGQVLTVNPKIKEVSKEDPLLLGLKWLGEPTDCFLHVDAVMDGYAEISCTNACGRHELVGFYEDDFDKWSGMLGPMESIFLMSSVSDFVLSQMTYQFDPEEEAEDLLEILAEEHERPTS